MARASQSRRKVLVLFSGPYARPDGMAASLTKLGLEPILMDSDPVSSGGSEGDIMNNDNPATRAATPSNIGHKGEFKF